MRTATSAREHSSEAHDDHPAPTLCVEARRRRSSTPASSPLSLSVALPPICADVVRIGVGVTVVRLWLAAWRPSRQAFRAVLARSRARFLALGGEGPRRLVGAVAWSRNGGYGANT